MSDGNTDSANFVPDVDLDDRMLPKNRYLLDIPVELFDTRVAQMHTAYANCKAWFGHDHPRSRAPSETRRTSQWSGFSLAHSLALEMKRLGFRRW